MEITSSSRPCRCYGKLYRARSDYRGCISTKPVGSTGGFVFAPGYPPPSTRIAAAISRASPSRRRDNPVRVQNSGALINLSFDGSSSTVRPSAGDMQLTYCPLPDAGHRIKLRQIQSCEGRCGRIFGPYGVEMTTLNTPRMWPISTRSCNSSKSMHSTRRPRRLIAWTRWTETNSPSAFIMLWHRAADVLNTLAQPTHSLRLQIGDILRIGR